MQPVPQAAYGTALDNFSVVDGLSQFGAAEWDAYRQTVVHPNSDPHRKRGEYAVAVRKGQKARSKDESSS